MKHRILIPSLAISLAFFGAACSLTTTVNRNVNTAANANQAVTISYAGQDGKNALELLESGHQVDVSDQGFVNTIDGIEPGPHQFWAFYVNGTSADVGAKDYQTKSSDTIEWKLEAF